MRNIKYIAVHCTATSQTTKITSIQKYWKEQLGWKKPGYHFIITPDGTITSLLPITEVSNGVAGFNRETINIAYLGGIDKQNKPLDNRTPAQKESLLKLLKELKEQFKKAKIQGHRDFPKVKKACPSFAAKTEYQNL